MNKITQRISLAVLAAVIAGCASSPAYSPQRRSIYLGGFRSSETTDSGFSSLDSLNLQILAIGALSSPPFSTSAWRRAPTW
jgi:predicted component of type VI protein secretion system